MMKACRCDDRQPTELVAVFQEPGSFPPVEIAAACATCKGEVDPLTLNRWEGQGHVCTDSDYCDSHRQW